MKEITRIHLAKIAYDIELDAKKDIQKYIAALEQYADDSDLLGDIEIRITELLAERGVAAGGVIAADDVAAVRAQLGEPSDFAPEGIGDIAVGGESDGPERRVYRDVDGAVLGGVLSGVAKYIGIDPLWARLIFLIVLIASFGTALIVYCILWLVIPPARTAAEKLRMSGQPVTLASLKQLGEQTEPIVNDSARVLKTVLAVGAGIVLVLMAIGALVAIPLGIISLAAYDTSSLTSTWWVNVAVGLFALSGVLFAALCILLATALFRHRWTKKTGVAVAVIIATGLAVFVGGLGVGMYGRFTEQTAMYNSQVTTKVNLPDTFKLVKTLTVGGDTTEPGYANIEYIVSDKLRYELDALPGVKPQITISDDGASATLSVLTEGQYPYWHGGILPTLRIYGPALDTVTLKSGTLRYYSATTQDELVVTSEAGSLTLGGSYTTVRAESKDAGTITAEDATVENLIVRLESGRVAAGVVRTLTVEQPDVCPAHDGASQNRLVVRNVSGGTMSYNGVEQPAKSVKTDCGAVIVGSEYDDEEWES